MLFTKLTWSITALVVSFQMIVAAATVSILTFHPEILKASDDSASDVPAIEVSYVSTKDVDDVKWNLCDLS